MRRIVVASTVLLAVMAAGSAWALDGFFDRGERGTWGGGRYGFARELSLDAHGIRGGSASGAFSWGGSTSGLNWQGHVTCLTVEGETAIVGGVVDRSPDGRTDGDVWFFVIEDRGGAGSPTRDRIGVAMPNDTDPLPEGAPWRCPRTTAAVPGLFGLVLLDAGDIAVEG